MVPKKTPEERVAKISISLDRGILAKIDAFIVSDLPGTSRSEFLAMAALLYIEPERDHNFDPDDAQWWSLLEAAKKMMDAFSPSIYRMAAAQFGRADMADEAYKTMAQAIVNLNFNQPMTDEPDGDMADLNHFDHVLSEQERADEAARPAEKDHER